MKNRKGFTIVELVIVIAVIAILAAVLIPTFSGIIQKANESAAMQEARAALSGVIAMSKSGEVTEGTAFVSSGSTFYYRNNSLDAANEGTIDLTPKAVAVNNEYYVLNDKGTEAIRFSDDAHAVKVLSTLGYEVTTDTIAKTSFNGYIFDTEAITSKPNVITQYTVTDGSTTYYVLVANQTVYQAEVTEANYNNGDHGVAIMEPGIAYVSTAAAAANKPFADASTHTSFQLLFNPDFSENVIVVIPD